MNEAEFNQIVDDLMFSIEETIDDSGADIDYENSGGMLTLTCDVNGSQIILSRQPCNARDLASCTVWRLSLYATEQGTRELVQYGYR